MKKSVGWREGMSCCGQILHLLPDSSIPWASLMLDSLSVHAHLYTPSKPTPSTLVAMCLIHYTLGISTLTGVVTPTPYTSLEESCTTITSKYFITQLIVPGYYSAIRIVKLGPLLIIIAYTYNLTSYTKKPKYLRQYLCQYRQNADNSCMLSSQFNPDRTRAKPRYL